MLIQWNTTKQLRKWTTDGCDYVDDSQEHFQWKKPDTQKGTHCMHTFLKSSKTGKTNSWCNDLEDCSWCWGNWIKHI